MHIYYKILYMHGQEGPLRRDRQRAFKILGPAPGLGDPKKFKFLSDIVREKSLDFIALSENGRRDCSMNFLKNLCEGKYYLWHCKAPRG